MDKEWKREQLEKITAQTSIFKHIPPKIGRVLYCDTNLPKESPLSEYQINRKRIISISTCCIVLLLYWTFLYTHFIWGTILTLIAILLAISTSVTIFSGADFFVGEDGFAIVKFYKSRDYITSCKMFLYKDIDYFIFKEIIRSYLTEYNISIGNALEHGTLRRSFCWNGIYPRKSQVAATINNEVYCMLEEAKKVWSALCQVRNVERKIKTCSSFHSDEDVIERLTIRESAYSSAVYTSGFSEDTSDYY